MVKLVSLIDADESSTANITSNRNMTLDIGVAAPVVHAKGQVNLKAGNNMTLSTTGADGRDLKIANLYADGDKAVITAEATEGTLTISNNGAAGIYADNGGKITLEERWSWIRVMERSYRWRSDFLYRPISDAYE